MNSILKHVNNIQEMHLGKYIIFMLHANLYICLLNIPVM